MKTRAILIGLGLGLGLGIAASVTGSPALLRLAEGVAPLGQVFLRAIQMVVIPLVAAIVFVGVARIGNLRRLGRIGGLAVGFFWLTSLPAILIGMGVMRLGLSLTAPVAPPAQTAEVAAEAPGVADFLVNLVPRNPVEAAATGSLLPLLIFIVLLAAAATTLPRDKRDSLTSLAEALGDALIRLMHWVLWTAPVGVFALAAPVTARTGVAMLQNLGVFVAAVVVGLFVMKAVVLLPLVRLGGGMPARRFVRGTVGSYTLGFSTTSSVATLPMMLEEAERLGVSRDSYRLILPLAASVNRPGSALFQGASVVFLAAMYGVPLGPAQVAVAVLATFLAAMTVAPVPSASIVSMVPALNAVGVPVAGLGILLGIDRLPDVFRSAANVIGHMAAATTVDALTRHRNPAPGADAAPGASPASEAGPAPEAGPVPEASQAAEGDPAPEADPPPRPDSSA